MLFHGRRETCLLCALTNPATQITFCVSGLSSTSVLRHRLLFVKASLGIVSSLTEYHRLPSQSSRSLPLRTDVELWKGLHYLVVYIGVWYGPPGLVHVPLSFRTGSSRFHGTCFYRRWGFFVLFLIVIRWARETVPSIPLRSQVYIVNVFIPNPRLFDQSKIHLEGSMGV